MGYTGVELACVGYEGVELVDASGTTGVELEAGTVAVVVDSVSQGVELASVGYTGVELASVGYEGVELASVG